MCVCVYVESGRDAGLFFGHGLKAVKQSRRELKRPEAHHGLNLDSGQTRTHTLPRKICERDICLEFFISVTVSRAHKSPGSHRELETRSSVANNGRLRADNGKLSACVDISVRLLGKKESQWNGRAAFPSARSIHAAARGSQP